MARQSQECDTKRRDCKYLQHLNYTTEGNQDKLTRKQFFDFLRINEYFSDRARRRRINLVASSVSGEPPLERLWAYLESTYGSELSE